MTADIGRDVLTGLKWNAGARLGAQLLNWTVTLVVIRLLSPEDYGLMSMTTALVGLLGIFSDLGLGLSVVQSKELDEPLLRKIYGMVLVSHVALFALLFAAAPLLAAGFGEPQLVPLVQVISTQFALTAVAWVPSAIMTRQLRFRALSVIEFISFSASALATLALALHGAGVWALVVGSFAKMTSRIVLVNCLCRVRFKPSFDFRGLGAALSFGGLSTLSGVLWHMFSQVDALILGKIAGKEALGVYSVAMQLAALPLAKVLSVVQPIAFPAFARLQHDPSRVASAVLRSVRAAMMVAVPVFFGLSAVAPEAVAVILGQKWAAAAVPLQLLPLIMPIRLVTGLVTPAVTGIGRADIVVRNNATALAVMAAGFLVGSHWGALGVALAWVILYPLTMVVNFKRSLSALALTRTDVLRALARPVVAAVVMYVIVATARASLPAQLPDAIRLMLLVLAGIVAYSTWTACFNRTQLREVVRLARG
jgi:O-antigen/teichoic acid export membrane protein